MSFKQFPDALTTLSQLEELNLTHLTRCKIEKLPENLHQLTKLKELYLGGNIITTFPKEIQSLTSLERFKIWGNKFDVSYFVPFISRSLKELSLRNINLKSLPTALFEFEFLEELDISNNQIEEIPATVQKFKNLKTLKISNNLLKNLPPNIASLQKLEVIDCSFNQLGKFPATILKLKQLRELKIHFNDIGKIPKEIQYLSKLEKLHLTNANLTSIPEEIGELRNLKVLLIGNLEEIDVEEEQVALFKDRKESQQNTIKQLPIAISQLTELEILHLTNLKLSLSNLPDLSAFKNLKTNESKKPSEKGLSLRGNPEIDISDEMFDRPPKDLIEYLLQFEKGKSPLNEAKLILVGDGKVGKTSIVNRLLFDTFNKDESQTDGVDIKDWKLSRNDSTIRLSIWDFGGQQIMHTTHRFFMTRRSVYILVVEPRVEDKQGETPLHYWLTHIKSYAGLSPVIVVVNKCEDGHDVDLSERELRYQYPQIISFVRISCKEGKISIY